MRKNSHGVKYVVVHSVLLLAVLGVPRWCPALTGGPDAFGYRFIDSDSAGGPAFNFEDISTTGTGVSLSDDQVSGAVNIGFTFDFYGTSYTQVYISSNSFLTFLAGQANGCCSASPMPSAGSPDAVIAAWWGDIFPPGGGSIRYQTLGS